MREDEEEQEHEQPPQQTFEDESAQDYPLHDRMIFKPAEDNSPRIEGEEKDTPTLAFVARENAMSFGMVGQQTQPFKPSQIMLSEQSDDFYLNSGRSNHTKMSSQIEVEVNGSEFSHIAINDSVKQAQTEASNAYQTHQMNEKFGRIQSSTQQYEVQTQQPG